MDGSNSNSSSPAPFLLKTYEMVDDPSTHSIVSWSQTGLSFVVWDPQDFASDLLPKYFKHGNFSSFIRQLNTYGFRKIDPDQWEFANEEFIRGHVHLLKNIHRRKPIHSHSNNPTVTAPSTNSEAEEYKKEIEKLRRGNLSLQLEAERQSQENREYESQLHSLHRTLEDIDRRQRQLILTMSQLLHKQGFSSSFMDSSESYYSKKRRTLMSFDYHEDDADDDLMASEELVDKFDSSMTFWEGVADEVEQNYVIVPEGLPGFRADPGSEHGVGLSPTGIFDEEKGGYVSLDVNDIFWEQFLTDAPPGPFTAS